jgi:hypothetical protein
VGGGSPTNSGEAASSMELVKSSMELVKTGGVSDWWS